MPEPKRSRPMQFLSLLLLAGAITAPGDLRAHAGLAPAGCGWEAASAALGKGPAPGEEDSPLLIRSEKPASDWPQGDSTGVRDHQPVRGVRPPSDFQSAPDFQPVRDHIRRIMEERGLPSVSVAVAAGEAILWEESFGWADVEARRPASPHTPYSLASISKPITATGVLLLREEGRVELDAPLDAYMGGGGLRGLAGSAEDATVRKVMAHTAGLPLHYTFFYQGEGVDPPPPAETLRRYGILVFPPGERFEYSNLGYGLLDFLIRNVSGEGYGEFMTERVFRPLGMNRTAVGIPPGAEDGWARRYGPEGQRLPFYDFDHPGASAVFASAHDLVRFGAFHLGHWIPPAARGAGTGDPSEPPADSTDTSADPLLPPPDLLPPGVLREMQTPQAPPEGNGYGLGWFIQEEYGFRKVYHTGSMPGVSTMLALYPTEEVAIVVLLNALDREQRVEIAREIAAVVIPGYREARDRTRRWEQEGAGEGEGVSAPGDASGVWEGTLTTWEAELPVRLEVDPDGNGSLTLEDGPSVVLEEARLREGVFTARAQGRIPTADAARHSDQVLVAKLVLRKEEGKPPTMDGQLTAQTTAYPAHFALSSYLRVAKVR